MLYSELSAQLQDFWKIITKLFEQLLPIPHTMQKLQTLKQVNF